MFAVLAQQELVRHSRHVIADRDVPRFHTHQLLMRCGHGARRTQVIVKEFFQSAHGAVAVFGDDRLLVHMRKEEPFELRVARRSLAAECTAKCAREKATVFSLRCFAPWVRQ